MENLDFLNQVIPDMSKIPGGVLDNSSLSMNIHLLNCLQVAKDVFVYEDAISACTIQSLKTFFPKIGSYSPVSVQGMADINDCGIGSQRITAFMPNLARYVSSRLSFIDKTIVANDFTPTDWHQGNLGREWEFVGISPMLRFMKYTEGGKHFPHYDAGYIYPSPNDEYRTLYSFILYLTTNDSGATRFISDGQETTMIQARNHDDWTREANDDEVFYKVLPKAGRLVVFPHRLCHDVEEFTDKNSERIIIRGDVLFKLKK